MEDSLFGFNTSITGLLDEGLHDEPGQGLEEEDEEEYDALNDETFGTDAVECDWEEDHEKLAELTEQSRVHHNSYCEADDLALEASLAQLVLDYEDDDDDLENGDHLTATPTKTNSSRRSSGVESSSYSSSAPSGFSVWGVGKQENHHHHQLPMGVPSHNAMPRGKVHASVCTVEELERDLISQRAQPPIGLGKPSVLRLEDVERDLGMGRGQPHLYSHQDVVLLRNGQNGVASLSRGHYQPHLPPPGPPVLGLGRGGVMLPGRLVTPPGIHPSLTIPDLRQLQQQNHRLMGSAPNLLHFLPHLMVQQAQANKGLGHHQPFPGDNGMLRPMHHRGGNLPYRPGFPQHMDQHSQHRPGGFPRQHQPGRGFPHHGQLRGPRIPQQNGSGDHDAYAGLMTPREKQWLLNIQLLQLNTDRPHVDDFYYTVFVSRQPKSKREGMAHRERRDSYRDREQRPETKVYTPAQFENSLGKLQIGSVTAPRKIIDMDVVSPEGMDTAVPTAQRDTRKVKQILLEIERLYLLVLQMEDLNSPLMEVRETVTESKAELLQKVLNSLFLEDRLVCIMCIRKGKTLILRLLPHLPPTDNSPQLLGLWTRLLRGLVPIGRKDQSSDLLLPRFYPHLSHWVGTLPFPPLARLAASLLPDSSDPARATPPGTKNTLAFALSNKFGVSALACMLGRAEALFATMDEPQQQEWSVFVAGLVDAAGLAAVTPDGSLPSPLEPLDSSLLTCHLSRWNTVGLHIEKYALLERAFTSQDRNENL